MLFKENIDVVKIYKSSKPAILVDELQDISPDSLEIVSKLFGKCITAAGDPDQSIYGFRGANPEVCNMMINSLKDPIKIKLDKNYRSSHYIINTANSILDKENFVEITDNSTPVKVIIAKNDNDEAEYVVAEIEKLCYPGSSIRHRNICIMTRTRASAAKLELELFRHSIPYTHKKGLSFFSRQAVREILGLLRFALSNEPDNSLLTTSFHIIAHSIAFELKDTIISEIEKHRGKKSILDFLNDIINKKVDKNVRIPTKYTPQLNKIVKAVNDINKEIKNHHSTLPQIIYNTSRFFSSGSELLNENDDDIIEEIENSQSVEMLVDEAKRFAKRYHGPRNAIVSRFIDHLTVGGTKVGSNSVILSTIHQMKGLESQVCFVCGLREGILPHSNSLLSEEKRIFYVAMTRARQKLYIVGYSNKEKNIPVSSFIKELKREYITIIDRTNEEIII